MSNPIITLLETNSIMDALQTMTTNNFRRLPVINKEEKLVGIVTNKDIFKIIINNKGLLADYYNNKNFQHSYSLLQENKEQIFEGFFKS
jgi:predicted transcriptional regulator